MFCQRLPNCVQYCEVRDVYLFTNPDIGQRLRVRKDNIEEVANSVSVFSTRDATRDLIDA